MFNTSAGILEQKSIAISCLPCFTLTSRTISVYIFHFNGKFKVCCKVACFHDDFSIFTRIVSFYVQCLPCVYSTSDFSVTTQNLPAQAFKLKEFTNIMHSTAYICGPKSQIRPGSHVNEPLLPVPKPYPQEENIEVECNGYTSSLSEIFTDELGNRQVVRWEVLLRPSPTHFYKQASGQICKHDVNGFLSTALSCLYWPPPSLPTPTTLYLHRLMTRSACPPGLAGSRL